MAELRTLVVLFVFLVELHRFNSIRVDHLSIIEKFLGDTLPRFLGQRANNENGTYEQFKNYAMNDESNDEIGQSTPQQIISRSGYNYENHYALADDGYITQLIRIVNPMADPSQLKQPPIMLMHGGTIDSTVYIWASAIQHYPEKYPRTIEDGLIKSWNRSLAFVLSNNGYDVWLVGTRGANSQNQGHIRSIIPANKNKHKKLADLTKLLNSTDSFEYWQYSMDDIIQNEVPRQMDKIMSISGAQSISLVALSLSTQITLGMLASNPDYATKVHSYVSIAPIINNKGASKLITYLHKNICLNLPDEVGTLSQQVRDLNLFVSKYKEVRYSFVKIFTTFLGGPSPKYQTLLEPAVIGHIAMPTGYKELKHYCQQVIAAQLRKFDYGRLKNKKLYGNFEPPAYDLSNIGVKNWVVVSGGNDVLATTGSVQQIFDTVKPKPLKHIFAANYNHLDLVAGFENDIYVNLPILDFLEQVHLPPRANMGNSEIVSMGSSKQQNLEQFVPLEPQDKFSILDGIRLRNSSLSLPAIGNSIT